MRWLGAAFVLFVAGCASHFPETVELTKEGEAVEFTYDTPSARGYKLLGTVEGVAAANDVDVATAQAKNDLRNKAAILGAAIVTVDENKGLMLPLESKTKVTVKGRAFKPID